jgi:hypothetical protein
MTPGRKLWRIRFGIRSLLIGITVFCIWFNQQARLVREREEVRRVFNDRGGLFLPPAHDETTNVSWIRRLIGDEPVSSVLLFDQDIVHPGDEERIERAFPEAIVVVAPIVVNCGFSGFDERGWNELTERGETAAGGSIAK